MICLKIDIRGFIGVADNSSVRRQNTKIKRHKWQHMYKLFLNQSIR